MAGVKGKSGGPRKNSGGARPGSGRKAKVAPSKSANDKAKSAAKKSLEPQPHGGALTRSKSDPVEIQGNDTLKLLQDIAFGRTAATTIQVRAAIAAVQYTHTKRGDGGKKDDQAERAKKVGAGKFASSAPPKLVVNNRK